MSTATRLLLTLDLSQNKDLHKGMSNGGLERVVGTSDNGDYFATVNLPRVLSQTL